MNAISYAVKRIGIDHVGISSDFNHGGGIIGWKDESEALNVTTELLRRGYGEDEIAKLWGRNFLRVFREVENISERLRVGVDGRKFAAGVVDLRLGVHAALGTVHIR